MHHATGLGNPRSYIFAGFDERTTSGFAYIRNIIPRSISNAQEYVQGEFRSNTADPEQVVSLESRRLQRHV